MSKTMLSLLALAGDRSAALQAASQELSRAAIAFATGGNDGLFVSTLAALQAMKKGANVPVTMDALRATWDATKAAREAGKDAGQWDKSGKWAADYHGQSLPSSESIAESMTAAFAALDAAKVEKAAAAKAEKAEKAATAEKAAADEAAEKAAAEIEAAKAAGLVLMVPAALLDESREETARVSALLAEKTAALSAALAALATAKGEAAALQGQLANLREQVAAAKNIKAAQALIV